MNAQEKVTYILTSMEVLSKHSIPLSKSPNEYMALIDQELAHNSVAYDADATNILASVVYETEPASREAIDRIRK